jgi:hypothetical protein
MLRSPCSSLPRVALRRGALAIGALSLCAGLLAACGSSGSGQASSAAAKAACVKVSGALSDGPDPDADPVGYALAQIRPLQDIKVTSDASLQTDIDRLASAYQRFYDDNGAKASKSSVNAASKTINHVCPGAGAGI